MQQTPKVYLNMIVKDDEPVEIVKRSIDSVLPYVDGAYITITYTTKAPSSKNPLMRMFREYQDGGHVFLVSYFKWVYDFAVARQHALDQVPKGPHTYIYWQDADDILFNAQLLPDLLKEADENSISSVYLNYWYQVDLDEKGEVREVVVEHKRERLVKHDGTWKWAGSLHETLIEQRSENILKIFKKDMWVIHLSTGERVDKNIERNIKILEETAKREQGKDPRTLIYLAKAYYDKGKMSDGEDREKQFGRALKLFHMYLNGSGEFGTSGYREPSGWHEERSTAWEYVGEIAMVSQQYDVALQAFQSAIDEAPQFPNYYIDMCMAYLAMNDFKKAKHWLNLATAVPEPETTIITLPKELKMRSLEVSYQINFHEGKLDLAKRDAEILVELDPNRKDLQERLTFISSLDAFNKACQSVVFLGKYLEDIKEVDKLPSLIEAMPSEMRVEKFASEMRHKFLPVRKWESNEIAILCGPGFEEWSPKSLATGIGGSEEAVIYLSRELAKLGWKVTVYAHPGKEAGMHEGVEYRQWYDLNQKDEFNILVLWRAIGFLDLKPKAKFTMLWMHDMPNNQEFTKERLDQLDKVAVLSEYHQDQVRYHEGDTFKPLPTDKVFLTSNGITLYNPPKTWSGTHTRMIYMSSPDRGLPYLLNHWQEIRAACPKAELHVFYGFKTYDAIHGNNPARKLWKDKIMELMQQEGIVYHDRVGHVDLEREISASGIWAYPTDFTEISCISAMKCQALGALPVCTNFAALQETVKNGVKVDVDITTPDGQKEYFTTLIDVLTHPEKYESIRPSMMRWAQEYFSWNNVAHQWHDLFNQTIQKEA